MELINSDKEIEVLIMSRKNVPSWKENTDSKIDNLKFTSTTAEAD